MLKAIIVIAYACSPYSGSEAGVGWGFVQELSKHLELLVFTEEDRFKSDINRYLSENPASSVAQNVKFVFIKRTRNALLRKIFPPIYFLFYRRWQLDVLSFIERHVKLSDYQLIHHITLVGYREPGFSFRLDLPLVIGPIGGLGIVRWSDFRYFTVYGYFYYFFYNIINIITPFVNLRLFHAWNKASLDSSGLIFADKINYNFATNILKFNGHLLPEVGTPSNMHDLQYLPVSQFITQNPDTLQLIWVGLLENRKGLMIALKSLRNIGIAYELHIFGTGSLSNYYRAISKKYSINSFFHGQQSRSDVLSAMKSSDALLFTSVRDLTATVTIEASALGIPIIYANRGGFGHWIDRDSNYPVLDDHPLHLSFQQEIKKLYLLKISSNKPIPSSIKSPKINPLFHWPAKAKFLLSLYKSKLGLRDDTDS